jgi:hypothetical protein
MRRSSSYLNPKQTEASVTPSVLTAPGCWVPKLGLPTTMGTFSQDYPTMTVSVQHKTHIYCVQLKQRYMGYIGLHIYNIPFVTHSPSE